MRIALYAGTFDPATLGHIDIIERGANLFDQLIVAVSRREGKSPLFSLEERVTFLRDVFEERDEIEIRGFSGLLVEFADEVGARTLIRGLRGGGDFDDEQQMAAMNQAMAPHLDTVLLLTRPRWMGVSSTLIREIAMSGGDVTPYVSATVASALRRCYESRKG
jgi:pantetheine-phosphate adenylyltransferase